MVQFKFKSINDTNITEHGEYAEAIALIQQVHNMKPKQVSKPGHPPRPFYLCTGWRFTTFKLDEAMDKIRNFIAQIDNVEKITPENDNIIHFTIKLPDKPVIYDPDEHECFGSEENFYRYHKMHNMTVIPGETCKIRVSVFYDHKENKFIIEPNKMRGDSPLYYNEFFSKFWPFIEKCEKDNC